MTRVHFSILLLISLTLGIAQAQEPKEKGGDRPPEAGRGKRGDQGPVPKAAPRNKDDDRGPMPPGGPGRGGGFGMQGGGRRDAPDANEIRRMAEQFLRTLDRNGDGKLNSTEWEGLTPDPLTLDKNADGEITVEELSASPRWQVGGPGKRGFGGGGFGGGFGGGEGSYGGFGGGMPMPGGFGGMAGGYSGMPSMMGGLMPGPGGQPPQDDPEMRELLKQDTDLDREANELANRVRRASGTDREKLKSELGDLVNKHFDARQKRRELQLKRLQEELERLQGAISKRNASRETIVKNRIAELTGEPRDLDF